MEPLRKAERIAALLDGRMDERERAALLAELGASDDDLELLLDSAAITRELEEEDAAAGAPATHQPPAVVTAEPRRTEVIPITAAPSRRRRARWWSDPRAIAAAAVVVLAVSSSFWLVRGRSSSWPADNLPASLQSLPPDWSHPWPATRGMEGGGPRGTAVRFGVLATDLQVAARGDRRTAVEFTDSIVKLLSGLRPLAAAEFKEISDSPTPSKVRTAVDATRGAFDPALVDLGAWVEAGRLAARGGEAAYFGTRESRRFLDGPPPPSLGPATSAALGRVRDALRKGDAPDWTRVQRALDEVLQEAG